MKTSTPPRPAPTKPDVPVPAWFRWPPPGLERIQGDLWTGAWKILLGGGLLVLPLLWAATSEQPFYSVGPFGDAWWILLVTSLGGMGVLIVGFVDVARLLWRGARAADRGYGPWVMALVAADRERDNGFLLQGARAFSVLDPRARGWLRVSRLTSVGAVLGAGLWLPVGFTAAVLVASRGLVGPRAVMVVTLAPAVLLLLVAGVLVAFERSLLRRMRREWHARPWAADLVKEEIREWMAALRKVRGGTGTAAAPRRRLFSGLALRLAMVAAIAVALFVVAPLALLVGTSSVVPVLAMVAVPTFTRTQERAAANEPLWRYRTPVAAAVTPQDAGRALHIVIGVGSTEPSDEAQRVPAVSYPAPFIGEALRRENPTGVIPERWSEELFANLDALEPATLNWLRSLAEHPGLDEVATVARAEALDVASARWVTPFPRGVTAASFPIPVMRSLREAAYVSVARAVVQATDGDAAGAERTLRNVLTMGLLLGRDGPTLIDNLIGHVVAAQGAEALAGLWEATGREDDAETLRWSREVAASVASRARVSLPPTPLGALREMPAVVGDTTLVRGLRWEYFLLVSSSAPCLNLNRIVFGPDPGYTEWRERVHDSLVLFPSEEGLFEVMSRGWFDVGDSSRPRGWIGEVMAATLGGGSAPGSCVRILQELASGGAI